MTTPLLTQIPSVYHRRIGEILVTAIGDGVVYRDHDMMLDVSQESADVLLAAAFRQRFQLSINTFLVQTEQHTVLIDTGSGHFLGATAGRMLANLSQSGVLPDEIDMVLLTHMHPDHSAGLTDPETSEPIFPAAELVFDERESKHWFDEKNRARATEREQFFMFDLARSQVHPYIDRIRPIVNAEIVPGITAIPCPGHTPGHTAFMISSHSEQLLIWGDVVHMPEVQFPQPQVSMVVDVDPAMAAQSRIQMFDMAASERLLVTGMHLHYPGFGYVDRRENNYHFVPEPWCQVLTEPA